MDHPTPEHPLSGDSGSVGPAVVPAGWDAVVPAGLDAKLVLVRHGESTFIVERRFQGRAETPLSPTGLRQAGLVARRLARPHDRPALPLPGGAPVELVHSPLQRTAQTADAIVRAYAVATGAPLPTRPDPAFLEIAQGDWEGLHRDELTARYAAELSAWRLRPHEHWAPGGESLSDVQARVRTGLMAVLGRLAERREPGSPDRSQVAGYFEDPDDQPWSIVVGHDGVFKVTLLTLFNLPLDRFWMWQMDLCGITIVEFRGGRPVLRAHNLTAHLADLLDEDAQEELDERSRSGAL